MNTMVYHKDCAYYEHCKITELREAGHNIIIFECPKLQHKIRYYKKDFAVLKYSCRHFIPIQEELKL